MKKTLFLLILVAIGFSNFIYAQATPPIHTFVRNGCTNSATVTIDPTFFVVDRLYTQMQTIETPCPELPTGFEYQVEGGRIEAVKYILERNTGLDVWDEVVVAENSQNSYQFNHSYVQGSTYRVRIEIRPVVNNRFAVWLLDGCTIVGNVLAPSSNIVRFSEELEFIDSPVPSVGLIDVFGTAGNNVFCEDDPVFMNASNSFGETSYEINMSMFDLTRTTEQAWGDCGDYTGQIGDFIDVHGLWSFNRPNWDLWPDHSYRIHIIYKNSCNGWLNHFQWFDVVATGCRTAESAPPAISIYPNPTTDEIQFKGLETMDGGYQYQVIGLSSGRLEKQGHLPNSSMPIDVRELENGLYIVRLEMDGRVVTEKFSVLR